jgi:hypothetical protein
MALSIVRNVCLPYCLKRVSGKEYAFLNREYKPLGQCTYTYVDYAEIRLKLDGLGPKLAAKISCKGSSNLDVIYLYNDSCQPEESSENMQAYFKRLALLMSLKVSPPEAMPMS